MAAGNIGAAPNQIAQQAFDMRLAGKVEEAAQHLQAGVAADSTQAILFYELSRTKTFLMDFEGMQGAIERAAALAPDNADYHYFAGMASAYSLINAAHQGQEGEIKRFAGRVIDELEAALRCNPDHHEARCMLVQQFSVMAEDWDRAEAITRRYIDMNPPLPLLAFAWARLGQIEQRRGNLPAGQELIEKAMAMDPHLWRGFMPPAEELFTRP